MVVVRHSLVEPLVVVVGSLEVVPCPSFVVEVRINLVEVPCLAEERILVEEQTLAVERIQVGLEVVPYLVVVQTLVGLEVVPYLVVDTLADLVEQIQVNLVVEHIIAASL